MSPDIQIPWEQYPALFATREQGGCGHGCGAGWYALINEACVQFAEIQRATGVQVLCSTVKEKFAGLRMYVSITAPASMPEGSADVWFDIVQAIVYRAESQSMQTCEESGAWGKARPLLGWIKTLSDTEYSKRVWERYGQTVEVFEAERLGVQTRDDLEWALTHGDTRLLNTLKQYTLIDPA